MDLLRISVSIYIFIYMKAIIFFLASYVYRENDKQHLCYMFHPVTVNWRKKIINTHTISGINLCITHNVTPNDLLCYQLFTAYYVNCHQKIHHKFYVGLFLFFCFLLFLFINQRRNAIQFIIFHKLVLIFSTICEALFLIKKKMKTVGKSEIFAFIEKQQKLWKKGLLF